MKYVKPEIEVIEVKGNIFMAVSGAPDYSTATTALLTACGGYNGGAANNFSCSDFGGFNANNPPYQNAQAVVGDGIYVYDYKGGHWKEHKGKN